MSPETAQRERGAGRRIRRYLIAGLLVWLPIVLTVFILRFLVGLVNGVLPELKIEEVIGFPIPGLELVLAILVLLLTGVAVTNLVGREIVSWWEALMNRIPVVRSIYSGAKTFTETVFTDKGKSFKQVVMVEFPRKGVFSIGFITSHDLEEAQAKTDREVTSVFVPTTPNPTTGFLVLIPRDEVVYMDMTVDEAFKMLLTLGVVVPTWKNKPVDGRLAPPQAGP